MDDVGQVVNDMSAKFSVYKRQCRQRPPRLCQPMCTNYLSFNYMLIFVNHNFIKFFFVDVTIYL